MSYFTLKRYALTGQKHCFKTHQFQTIRECLSRQCDILRCKVYPRLHLGETLQQKLLLLVAVLYPILAMYLRRLKKFGLIHICMCATISVAFSE